MCRGGCCQDCQQALSSSWEHLCTTQVCLENDLCRTVIVVVPCLTVGLTKYIQLVSNNSRGTRLLLAALHLPRVKLRFLSCPGRNKDRFLKNKPQRKGAAVPLGSRDAVRGCSPVCCCPRSAPSREQGFMFSTSHVRAAIRNSSHVRCGNICCR